MPEPKIVACQPVKVSLVAGTKYAYCTCGLSAIQPFCDGTHRGTEFHPIKFIAERNEEVWMCLCKHSGTRPLCDGTHKLMTPGTEK